MFPPDASGEPLMQRAVDVVLVFMPYGTVDRPSIGLGYLAAALNRIDIRTAVVHGNVLFAATVGVKTFNYLNGSSNTDLIGEWTFAGAAFPDFHSSPDDYFQALHRRCTAEEESEVRRVRSLATPFVHDLADRILAQKPRMVGCSSMFQQNTASLALLRRIRELDPSVITVMGGANCEAEVGRALHSHFPWVDYIFSGECDELFPEFCRRLFFGSESVPADASEAWPPQSVLTPQTRPLGIDRPVGLELIKDMDRLPLPSFDDYFQDMTSSGLAATVSPAMIMETSRGCWWGEKHKCTFCGLSAGTIGFRSKSAEVAFREIEQLFDKYRLRHFELVDNIMDNTYYDTLLPRLANDPRAFRFFYEIKSNVTRRQVRLLADAGVAWVQPGIEGLNDRL
jgi:ribosomal peptide maturation radical SAM protein 1